MRPPETQGRKETIEAVVIAALTTLVNGLVVWGIDVAKQKAEERKKRRQEAKATASSTHNNTAETPEGNAHEPARSPARCDPNDARCE